MLGKVTTHINRNKDCNGTKMNGITIEIEAILPAEGCTKQHQWNLINDVQKQLVAATDALINAKELTVTAKL